MKSNSEANLGAKAKHTQANWRRVAKLLLQPAVVAIGSAAILLVGFRCLAVDPPVLTISNLSSNQFSVMITNGDATANYELYWAPVLANPSYPFSLLIVGTTGQTNFSIDAGAWQSLYFRASVGIDWDADGIPNYMDANPSDASIGALTVTIDSPVNGSELN